MLNELTFTLTIPEANLVMEALSEMPFKRVVMLVNKMNAQADAQAAAAQPEEKSDGAVEG